MGEAKGKCSAVPTSSLPTPTRVLRLAEGLVKIGFPPDVDRAVATLRQVTADDPAVLNQALVLARRLSRVRRSWLLVVELLIQSLIETEFHDGWVAGGSQLVVAGAD